MNENELISMLRYMGTKEQSDDLCIFKTGSTKFSQENLNMF